jgi:hypothetical protein
MVLVVSCAEFYWNWKKNLDKEQSFLYAQKLSVA